MFSSLARRAVSAQSRQLRPAVLAVRAAHNHTALVGAGFKGARLVSTKADAATGPGNPIQPVSAASAASATSSAAAGASETQKSSTSKLPFAAEAQRLLQLEAATPTLLGEQKALLQRVPQPPTPADLDLAVRVFDKVVALGKGVDAISVARIMLLLINAGEHSRALDMWTRVLETLGARTSPASLPHLLSRNEFEPTALAALAAYFAAAGDKADPRVAQQLVPRRRLPRSTKVLRSVATFEGSLAGSRKDSPFVSAEVAAATELGLARLRAHMTDNFRAPEFLEELATASFGQVSELWTQVNAAVPDAAQIPETVYVAFIRSFAQTKQTTAAFNLWRQLVRTGVTPTGAAWAALLKAALQLRENSKEIFDALWIKMEASGAVPSAELFDERLLRLTQEKEIGPALALFRALRDHDFPRTPDPLAGLIPVPPAELGAAVTAVKTPLLDVRGFNIVVAALARRRRYEEVDALLDWATQGRLTTVKAQAAAQAAAKPAAKASGATASEVTSEAASEASEASEVVGEEVASDDAPAPLLPLNSYTFNALINNAPRERPAMYFQLMLALDVAPDVVTFTYAVDRQLKRGLPVGPLLEEMKAGGIVPNAHFETMLAYNLGKHQRDVHGARQLLSSLLRQNIPVSESTLGSVIELELRFGEPARAGELLRTLWPRLGLQPSVPVHNQVVHGALLRDDFATAREALDRLWSRQHRRLAPNVYTWMEVLTPWKANDLQARESVRRLVRDAMAVLAAHLQRNGPGVVDYTLATTIMRVSENAPDLVPADVLRVAHEQAAALYDKRLQRK